MNPPLGALMDSDRKLLLSLVLLGFSSMVAQLVFFRELLCVCCGNELVIGIVLGNWLLLTGLGATINRIYPRTPGSAYYGWILLCGGLLALVPTALAQVFILRALPRIIFGIGAVPGAGGTFLLSLFAMMPFCLLSGWLLTWACAFYRDWDRAGAGRVYIADSLGGLVGGLLFTIILTPYCSHIEILLGIGLLHAGVVWRMSAGLTHCRAIRAGALLCGTLMIGVWGTHLDQKSLAAQYPGQRMHFCSETPHGRVVLTETAGQWNCLMNGVPVSATHNQSQVEEAVHFAMAQRPQAKRVLSLSGNISGLAREFLKYPVREITCVEMDPVLVQLSRQHPRASLSDPRIKWVVKDGRRFIQQSDQAYDVILVNVPDPSTSQINRFFTQEFFQEAKRILSSEGVLAFSLGGYENYMSEHMARIIASAYCTVHLAFSHVMVLPGMRIFYLASDGPLSSDIPNRLKQLGIETKVVLPGYWQAMISSDRLDDIQRALSQSRAINRDLDPVLYFHHLRHWLSQHSARLGVIWGAALLALGLGALSFRRHLALPAVLVSGFTASSLQLVLLLVFQLLVGSMYRELGVLNALFMFGLALGAWWGNRLKSNVPGKLACTLFGLACVAAILPACLTQLHAMRHFQSGYWIARLAIPAFGIILSIGVGLVFPLACQALPGTTQTAASSVYAADFLGAFAGAVLSGVYLVPVWGIARLAVSLAILNGALAFCLWICYKRVTHGPALGGKPG